MEGKCPVCGAPMENGVCSYCGYKESTPVQTNAPQQNVQSQPQIIINNQNIVNNGIVVGVSRKSKTVALLLCIFLGCWGGHRFYTGKVWTGILYLCTGGLFGIGWIVDIILIATGNFKDRFNLPLRQ